VYKEVDKETNPGEMLSNWAWILKVRLTESRRVGIPLRVEKEPERRPEGTDISPQRLRNPVG
jgi:hypothetical protein